MGTTRGMAPETGVLTPTRYEIVGTVTLMKSDPLDGSCRCCPGHASHVFASGLDLDAFGHDYPWPPGIKDWLSKTFDYKAMEGRRIKITAELLPAPRPGAARSPRATKKKRS